MKNLCLDGLQKLQNGSDVRGVAIAGVEGENVNLTSCACLKIACAFVSWLSSKHKKNVSELKIGVGRDSRVSGAELLRAAIAGINQAGATAIDCGMATTPAMFMSCVFDETKFDGAIMMTASHLPYNRNGMKFFDADGGLEKENIADILQAAEKINNPPNLHDADAEKCNGVTGESAASKKCRAAQTFDLMSRYAKHLRDAICKEIGGTTGASDAAASSDISTENKPLANLHIVVDAGNGAGGFFATDVLKPLGADISGSQFLEPDGMFPNHIPNPENKTAMEAIRAATVKNHADLGLIFDTDVDRMSAVFSNGDEVNRDSIIALVAAILAPIYPQSTIITDSVTSDRLTFFLEKKLGLKHLCFKRGYKNVINKCKKLNSSGEVSPLAMETSGHGALKDNYYLDDGAFLAVKLVAALAQSKAQNKTLDSYIAELPAAVAGEEAEYRFKINTADFKPYGQDVLEKFKKRAGGRGYALPASYEGVRVSFDDENVKGWMLLRLSLHDPVMPLNVEGLRAGSHKRIVAIAKELLSGFEALDMSCLN